MPLHFRGHPELAVSVSAEELLWSPASCSCWVWLHCSSEPLQWLSPIELASFGGATCHTAVMTFFQNAPQVRAHCSPATLAPSAGFLCCIPLLQPETFQFLLPTRIYVLECKPDLTSSGKPPQITLIIQDMSFPSLVPCDCTLPAAELPCFCFPPRPGYLRVQGGVMCWCLSPGQGLTCC